MLNFSFCLRNVAPSSSPHGRRSALSRFYSRNQDKLNGEYTVWVRFFQVLCNETNATTACRPQTQNVQKVKRAGEKQLTTTSNQTDDRLGVSPKIERSGPRLILLAGMHIRMCLPWLLRFPRCLLLLRARLARQRHRVPSRKRAWLACHRSIPE